MVFLFLENRLTLVPVSDETFSLQDYSYIIQRNCHKVYDLSASNFLDCDVTIKTIRNDWNREKESSMIFID